MSATDSLVPDTLALIGRCAIALMFFASARDKFRGDPQEIAMIRSLHLPVPELLERATGVFELALAVMLVLGTAARVAAFGLAIFVSFITVAFLRYWSFQGPPEARQGMRNAFYGNWAAVGALLYVMTVGPGQLSLWP